MFKDLDAKKQRVNKTRNPQLLEGLISVPDGMYEKCPKCGQLIQLENLQELLWVCDSCSHHFRIHCASRIRLMFDSFKVFHHRMSTLDPLNFPNYKDKVEQLKEYSGVYDAVVCGEAKIGDQEFITVIMDPHFMMGSMGSVVGEKIALAFERATKQKKPIVVFTASGGARMQEGIISLMQMAKTSGAVSKFNEKKGLYISVLTDPTTGGVTASFAMLADIVLAEPGALIAFAGPRVIKQTIQTDLPEGFQSAEFLLEKGFVDKIVSRHKLKATLNMILEMHGDKK